MKHTIIQLALCASRQLDRKWKKRARLRWPAEGDMMRDDRVCEDPAAPDPTSMEGCPHG